MGLGQVEGRQGVRRGVVSLLWLWNCVEKGEKKECCGQGKEESKPAALKPKAAAPLRLRLSHLPGGSFKLWSASTA
jgi:hypothetical protein